MPNSENIAQLNTRISRVAKERLLYACEVRGNGLGHVNQGVVVTDLIMTTLPPAPGEKKPVKKTEGAEKLRVVMP